MLLGASLFIIKLCRGPRWKVPLWEDEILKNLYQRKPYNHLVVRSILVKSCHPRVFSCVCSTSSALVHGLDAVQCACKNKFPNGR